MGFSQKINKAGIILIEDNRNLRDSWQTIINNERDIFVAGSFISVEDAMKSDVVKRATLILMDIHLPGMSGIDGINAIHEINPDIPVVIVTVNEEDASIFHALKEGAIGYLLKQMSTTELIQAIHNALEGGSPMSPTVARKVIESFRTVWKNKCNVELSARELEILQQLADGKTYAAIAKSIFLSVDGVSYHVRNIYYKLQVKSRAEAVREGIRRKLINLFK